MGVQYLERGMQGPVDEVWGSCGLSGGTWDPLAGPSVSSG